jgi:hypothetical protein
MAGAIVNPRVLNIARPNARLRGRQRIIRARMGNVTPPPTIALPAPAESSSAANPDEVPAAPPDGAIEDLLETAPTSAPGGATVDKPEITAEPDPPAAPVTPDSPGAGQ